MRTGAHLLIVAAAGAAFAASAGARILAPPGNAFELNMSELNTVGDLPDARGPNVGLICVWAIHAGMLEMGRRCGVTARPAFLAELERSVARMEDYARRQSPARAADMAAYRQREIVGDTRLCSVDAIASYNDLSGIDLARIRRDTDELLARSPAVELGDTCA